MRFQVLLGFVVLAGAGLLAWSHLNSLVPEERPVRAQAEARELASAVLDYHADTGQWPQGPQGKMDLAPLLGRPTIPDAQSASLTSGNLGGGLGGLSAGTAPLSNGSGVRRSWLKEIPLDPWDQPYRVLRRGEAVAVLSTGPNRKLDTDPAWIWIRPADINPCDGDDVGIVRRADAKGGFR